MKPPFDPRNAPAGRLLANVLALHGRPVGSADHRPPMTGRIAAVFADAPPDATPIVSDTHGRLYRLPGRE